MNTWRRPHRQPELQAGCVHVWRADLDVGATTDLLSPEERDRARRIVDERRRRRFVAARQILRSLLGGYLRCDPRSLELVLGADGKPALAKGQLRFNLAHSAELALFAFSREHELGVDVERGERLRDVAGVARRLLGADAERLLELDESTRRRELLRAWVRAEAIVKCDGRGLRVRAEDVTDGIAVIELEAGTGAAALALAGPEAQVELWRWPPNGA
jgi:4'-phosphopantetheinyl transferase